MQPPLPKLILETSWDFNFATQFQSSHIFLFPNPCNQVQISKISFFNFSNPRVEKSKTLPRYYLELEIKTLTTQLLRLFFTPFTVLPSSPNSQTQNGTILKFPRITFTHYLAIATPLLKLNPNRHGNVHRFNIFG